MNILVIEGAGDIVSRAVASAAQKLKIDIPELRVIFTDKSEDWTKDIAKDRKRTIGLVRKWGAEFLDKSKRRDRAKYNALLNADVDAVLIETPDRTHIELAKHWLKGNCKWIFVEKPLTTHLERDREEAKRWVEALRQRQEDYERVLIWDHYRGRVHAQFKYPEQMTNLLNIIGLPKSFRFYFLEDHSGTDDTYLKNQRGRGRKFTDRNGPIENEGRVDALQHGIILDLMPHILSVLEYFGHPETVEVRAVRPGIYTGVDYKPGKRSLINNETFAAIDFDFSDNLNRRIRGEAYVGKGIYGSEKYDEMNGNVKLLEVEGEKGATLVFDFHYNIISVIGPSRKSDLYDLERDAYYYLLTDIAFRMEKGTHLGLSPEIATIILDKLAEMKSLIDPASLATYELGDGSGKLPPLLEDLLSGGRNQLPLLTR